MMEDVLIALEKRHVSHKEHVMNQAHLKANHHKDTLVKEYDTHLVEKRKEIERKVRFHKNQGLSFLERDNKLKLDQIKNDAVDTLLIECKTYFENLSSPLFLALIEGALERNNGAYKPRIFVESRHFEAAKERFGVEYQVINANLLGSGFVLSFETYDVSFDLEQIFKFRYDVLSKRAMHLLFEDDSNV